MLNIIVENTKMNLNSVFQCSSMQNPDPGPDPDPYSIRIRIRIESMQIRDPAYMLVHTCKHHCKCTLMAMRSGHVALAWVWFGYAWLGSEQRNFGGKILVGDLTGKRCFSLLVAKDKVR